MDSVNKMMRCFPTGRARNIFIATNAAVWLAIGAACVAYCDAAACTQLLVSLLTAYVIAMAVYLPSDDATRPGAYTLFATAAIMSAWVILNVLEFTTIMGGTLSSPCLMNDDAFRYYDQASEIFFGEAAKRQYIMPALPAITAALWQVLGQSIVYPLALNVLLTLLSLIMAGRLARILLEGKAGSMTGSGIATLSMALTASVCHFVGNGTVLLKEPLIYTAMLLTAIPLAHLYRADRLRATDIIMFTAGNVIIATCRTQMFYFIALALILFAARRYTTHLRHIAVMLLISAACYAVGLRVTNFSLERHYETVTGEKMTESRYLVNDDNRYDNYNHLLGDYPNASVAKKLALLPVTAAVQYVVPFPWNFDRDIPFGYSQIYCHIGYPWYIAGGIILFFYLFVWLRRGSPLRLWGLWTLLSWLAVAYIFAGTVSRYMLPFVPLLMPAAVYVIARLRDGSFRRSFRRWYVCYAVLMCAGLIACHYIQQ